MMMPMAYTGPADLHDVLAAQARWYAEYPTPHPGNIVHRLFNTLLDATPQEAFFLVRDANKGTILAWVLFYRRFAAFDWAVQPDLRAQSFELELLDWCEARIESWLRADQDLLRPINTDLYLSDSARLQHFQNRGYSLLKAAYYLTLRDLTQPVLAPNLPEGYRIRAAIPEDAPLLAQTHAAAFGSNWTTESYTRFMQASADLQQELLVIAPDGRPVAFAVLWLDHDNRVGLLEPVGTHPDFQRRGLARALLLQALAELRDAGMQQAQILYEQDNAASAGLYQGLGFGVVDEIHRYYRMLPF